MPSNALISLASILAVTAACGLLGPEPSFSFAAATSGCGPADGPTTVILLAREPIRNGKTPFPNVTVEIWQPVNPLAGHTWSVGPNDGASAWYFTLPGRQQSASGGSITITRVDSSNTIEGSVVLAFPSRMVAKRFTAPWIASQGGLCG